MRLFTLVCCITLLSGCSKSDDDFLCQVEGRPFEGLFPLVKDSAHTTKVMMVHGVAKHEPGYSTQLLQGLANKMGLNQISAITKNITLTDPLDKTKNLGNLKIRKLSNEDESHDGDKQQRHIHATNVECEHLTGIRPLDRGRRSNMHIADQETREDKRVRDQEDPHHGLAPGHTFICDLVRAPVCCQPFESRW